MPFKLSQGSEHVNSMVLNPPTLIPCNKRVITLKVEYVYCSVYLNELWQGNSPGVYLLVCEALTFFLFENYETILAISYNYEVKSTQSVPETAPPYKTLPGCTYCATGILIHFSSLSTSHIHTIYK